MISQKQLKFLRALKHKKYRISSQKFLVEGLRNCEEALDSDFAIHAIFITPNFGQSQRQTHLLRKAREQAIRIITIPDRALAGISDTVHAQGIVAVADCRAQPFHLSELPDFSIALALDQINDPGNLGTILRTASWFGVEEIFIGKCSADVYNPKVIRGSMGAIFHLRIHENVPLHETILAFKGKFRILATAPHAGIAPEAATMRKPCILMIGNEARGLEMDLLQLSDQVVQIPRYGRAESLNVAVAVGILLAELTRRIHSS